MNRAAFAAYKRRVNADKSFIDVQLKDLDVFRYPGDEPLVLARFVQQYRSDRFSRTNEKEQYWRRTAEGRWLIVREASR